MRIARRKRTPIALKLAGSSKSHPVRSGPHSHKEPSVVDTRSMQPSGTRRCLPVGVAVYEQAKTCDNGFEGAKAVYQVVHPSTRLLWSANLMRS